MDEQTNPRKQESTVMPGPKTQTEAVKFTRKQYEWLNQMYPEMIGSATTPEAEYRFRAGQRSVIALIASRVDGAQIGE
jgi:hypothetical protein